MRFNDVRAGDGLVIKHISAHFAEKKLMIHVEVSAAEG